MGVRLGLGGVFPEEGTACGEEALERRAEGRPGGRLAGFIVPVCTLCWEGGGVTASEPRVPG